MSCVHEYKYLYPEYRLVQCSKPNSETELIIKLNFLQQLRRIIC